MSRQKQLLNLQSYIKEVDKDITMILQNLQWDRSLLQKVRTLSTCKYDENHKMPSNKLKEHEEMCFLKCNGYSVEDTLLPDILDMNANTVIKFSSATINDILNNAAMKDPLFKRGHNSEAILPLSVERMQATYTADERRAIHDAVVSSVQSYKDSEDFALLSGSNGAAGEGKTWLERLAEQRNRRRRRAKYRVPPKTRNYSLVLRDVISAQMEVFNELHANPEIDQSHKEEDFDTTEKETSDHSYKHKNITSTNDTRDTHYTHRNRHSRDKDKEIEHKNIGRYDRSTTEDSRSREWDRSRKESSSSREMKKYNEYKSEKRRSTTEDTRSRERDGSRKESSSWREMKKYNENKSEKRHKERETYSYGPHDRKREKYGVSRQERDKDRSYSKKNVDYEHKKDYRY